jgi:hypothetical protein
VGDREHSLLRFAQGKKACDLVTRADVESMLGVTLEEPTSTPDGSSCSFTNAAPNKPRPIPPPWRSIAG